jgi:hypothetical protein
MATVGLYITLEPEYGDPVTLARVRRRDLHQDAAEYSLVGGNGKLSRAKVQIGGVFGQASDQSIPSAICLATARAVGIEVEACKK